MQLIVLLTRLLWLTCLMHIVIVLFVLQLGVSEGLNAVSTCCC